MIKMVDTKNIVNKILGKNISSSKIKIDKLSLNKKKKVSNTPEQYTADEVLKEIGEYEYNLSKGC